MSRIASHLVVAAIALPAGALGASALAPRETSEQPRVLRRLAAPEHVRTVVVTRTIHRVRHVHARPHPAPAPTGSVNAPTAATPVAAPAAAPRAPVAGPPAVAVRQPAAPLRTRTSGASHGASGEHEVEHEREGGDD